jgi:hypothetical protein
MPSDDNHSSEKSTGSSVPPDHITPEEITDAVKSAKEKELRDAKKNHAAEIKTLRAKMTENRDAEMRSLREQQFAAALLASGSSLTFPFHPLQGSSRRHRFYSICLHGTFYDPGHSYISHLVP